MISLNNFHDMESSIEIWRSSSTNYDLFDHYTFSVCACSATVWLLSASTEQYR